MTHDELLFYIDEEAMLGQKEWKAFRAVVELHKPVTHKGYEKTGLFCNNCDFDYPCPTIQTIQEQLK